MSWACLFFNCPRIKNPYYTSLKIQKRIKILRFDVFLFYTQKGVAAKMASYLDVSLDFLVGASDEQIDKSTMTRVLELQKLPEDIKDKLYYFIDMTIRDFKAKQAYS